MRGHCLFFHYNIYPHCLLAKEIEYMYLCFMRLMSENEGGANIRTLKNSYQFKPYHILPKYHRCACAPISSYLHSRFVVYFHNRLKGNLING